MSATTSELTTEATTRRDALVGRLFESTVAAMDLLGVYIGDRLGLYRAVAETGRRPRRARTGNVQGGCHPSRVDSALDNARYE